MNGTRRYAPGVTVLKEGDVMVIRGSKKNLDRFLADSHLSQA